MKTVEIVFSPTGGTAAAAEALMTEWPAERQIVDLSSPRLSYSDVQIGADDLVLIAVPSFGGRAPKTAMTRLSEIDGNGAACALLCVYGNRAYEDTLVELFDTATKSGFCVIGAAVAVAEHSIVRQIAAGRPDKEDVRELASFGKEILNRAEADARSMENPVPGNRPYKKFAFTPMTPKGGRDCTSCGTCAEQCPTGAIDSVHPRKTDPDQCIACMRCVAVCPQKARSVSAPLLKLLSMALRKQASGQKKNEIYL